MITTFIQRCRHTRHDGAGSSYDEITISIQESCSIRSLFYGDGAAFLLQKNARAGLRKSLHESFGVLLTYSTKKQLRLHVISGTR